jgi:hypothetical protein
MNEAIIINTPEGINYARLCALKMAVRLETLGMRRSGGVSASAIAAHELGLKKGTRKVKVLQLLEERIKEIAG